MMSTVRSYLPETVNENVMYGIGVMRCYVQPYINTEFNANALVTEPRILVGDLASASNREAMKEQGITHVMCVLNGGLEQFPGEFEYMIVHANDDPWVDIDSHFEAAVLFIDQALTSSADTKILVHCQRGASRSVTLVSAYLLYNLNRAGKIPEDQVAMMVGGVIESIHNVRDIACPNDGFIEALKRYVCELNDYEYTPPAMPEVVVEAEASVADPSDDVATTESDAVANETVDTVDTVETVKPVESVEETPTLDEPEAEPEVEPETEPEASVEVPADDVVTNDTNLPEEEKAEENDDVSSTI
jgi:Dual specificity phosphatase, catalytic domain